MKRRKRDASFVRTRKFRHNDGHIKRKKSVCEQMCMCERHIKKSRVNDMLRIFNTAVLFAVQHFPNIFQMISRAIRNLIILIGHILMEFLSLEAF